MNFPVFYTSEQMERIQNFINETFGGGEEGFIGHELKSEYLRRYARQQESGRCAGTRCQHDQRKVLRRNATTEPINTRKEFLNMTCTWKVVYYLPSAQWSGGNIRGVAFVQAATQPEASWAFKQQYAGQFSTIEKIEKIGK